MLLCSFHRQGNTQGASGGPGPTPGKPQKGCKPGSLIPTPAPFLPHQAPKNVQVLARMTRFGGESEPHARKPPRTPPGPSLCCQSEGREARRGTAAGLSGRARGGDRGQTESRTSPRCPARPGRCTVLRPEGGTPSARLVSRLCFRLRKNAAQRILLQRLHP